MKTITKIGLALFENKRILMARAYGKTYTYFPGGKVEEGEDDRACLRREVREELAVELVLQ